MSLFGANPVVGGAMGGRAAGNYEKSKGEEEVRLDKLETSSANRRIMQEQWEVEKASRLKDMEAKQLKLQANKDLAQASGAFTPETWTAMQEENKQIKQSMNKMKGNSIGQAFASFLGSLNKTEAAKSFNAFFDSNPEYKQTLGVPKNAKFRPLSPESEYDKGLVDQYINRTDSTYRDLSAEEQEKVVQDAIKSGLYMDKGDGKVFNVKHASIGMGHYNQFSPEVKARASSSTLKDAITTNKPQGEYPMAEVVDNYIKGKEGNGTYTQKNTQKPGNTAYGKWQVTDATNRAVAKRLGISEAEARTPQGQERVYEDLKKEYRRGLDKLGLEHSPGNMYAMHQLGVPAGTRYFTGKLTDTDLKHMNENLDNKPGKSRAQIINEWTNKFVTPGNKLTGTQSQPSQASSSWRAQPYHSSDTPTRMEALRQIAGWSDDRPAMQKNMDYIAKQLGENATMGDVMDVLSEYKQSGSKGKEFNIDRQLELFEQDMTNQYGTDWKNNPEAVQKYNESVHNLSTKQNEGVGGVNQNQSIGNAVRGRGSWNVAKRNNHKVGYSYEQRTRDFENEQQAMALNKPKYNQVVTKGLKPSQEVYTKASNVVSEFEKLIAQADGDTLNKGWKDIIQSIAKYAPQGWLPDDQIEALNNTAGINTRIGTMINDYMKATTGLSFTDKEREQKYSQMGANFANDPKTSLSNMKAFLATMGEDVEMQADYAGNQGYVDSAKGAMEVLGYGGEVPRLGLSEANKEKVEAARNSKNVDVATSKAVASEYSKPMKPAVEITASSQTKPVVTVKSASEAKKLGEGARFNLNGQLYDIINGQPKPVPKGN